MLIANDLGHSNTHLVFHAFDWACPVDNNNLGVLDWACPVGNNDLGVLDWACPVGNNDLGVLDWACPVGNNDLGVLLTPHGRSVGIIHYAKSMLWLERWRFYLPYFTAVQ